MLSRSGEALDRFGGFLRYLTTSYGYEARRLPGAQLQLGAGRRRLAARPLRLVALRGQPCGRHARTSAAGLRWYRSVLPDDTRYHLIGYSLGGVALFEAAGALLFGEPERWQGRIGTLITLAAPLFGTDLGLEGDLLGRARLRGAAARAA